MNEFQVRPEKRKAVAVTLAVALALTALPGLSCARDTPSACGEDEVLGGLVLSPDFPPAQAVRLVDARFKKVLGLRMEHNVRLSLTNGTNRIDFIADGYNASTHIAYELLNYQYYTTSTGDILTSQEQALVRGYRFGEYYILPITLYYEAQIVQEVDAFIASYTNRGR